MGYVRSYSWGKMKNYPRWFMCYDTYDMSVCPHPINMKHWIDPKLGIYYDVRIKGN
jgi:hypothetical protein